MTNIGDWKSLAIILPNSVRLEKSSYNFAKQCQMVDGDGDDVVGWYDINYIYRRMTPRFVDYDEVEAGKIKQSFTFLLKDIT